MAKVKDDDGGFNEYTTDVTVNNVAPTITGISGSMVPVQVNVEDSITVAFTDPGTADTHSVSVNWGDINPVEDFDPVISPAIIGHTYSEAGVYTVTVTITDDDGGLATQLYQYIIVFDPSEGFVTGGGWIWSPAGAYEDDLDLEGKATFGFVSKYKKGATVPTGNTEFMFHAGDFEFHSSSYDWLVIAGSCAKYKGVGTINGEGEYKFMITALDGDSKDIVDRFRIKIWTEDVLGGESIVYDNQRGESDDSTLSTELGGGSVVIHTPKKK